MNLSRASCVRFPPSGAAPPARIGARNAQAFGPAPPWPRVADLSPADIVHVARIARLALTPEEEQAFAREAAAILRHFEAVMAAPAPPAGEEPAPLAPREDAVEPPEPAQVEAIVQQFPRKDGRRARVPGGL
jgi:Asp-tRNA(Asn)/Glu-tRNA(Gln) amidotransferase C subunit